MKDGNNLIKIYTGTEVTVDLLKAELEQVGIIALVQDDFSSAIGSGFITGLPSAIDLYINTSDMRKAKPIVESFLEINKTPQ